MLAEAGIKDKDGKTALMYASSTNNSDIVKVLAPFEIGIVDNNDNTALMLSC